MNVKKNNVFVSGVMIKKSMQDCLVCRLDHILICLFLLIPSYRRSFCGLFYFLFLFISRTWCSLPDDELFTSSDCDLSWFGLTRGDLTLIVNTALSCSAE